MKKKNSVPYFLIAVILLIIIAAVVYKLYENSKAKNEETLLSKTVMEEVEPERDGSSVPEVPLTDAHALEEEFAEKSSAAVPEKKEKQHKKQKEPDMGNDGYASSKIETPLCTAVLNHKKDGEYFEDHELHSYAGFDLCYRESYEVAEWVSYTLTNDELVKVSGRTNDFRADPSISTGSATPADYKKSGYDRGHLAPAADMEWSVQTVSESFYMSNMTPQKPELNRRLWMELESSVRIWASRFGYVTVVTGPVLEKASSEYDSIGENKVSVPEYFYKVLLSECDGRKIAAGFILPNADCTKDIFDYAVSVDEVERRTGLDFFSLLPDTEEELLESCTDFSAWK